MNRRLWLIAFAFVGPGIGVLGYNLGKARAAGIPPTGTMTYSGTLLNFGQLDTQSHNLTLNLWLPGNTLGCVTTTTGTTLTSGRFSVPLDVSCVPVIHQNPSVNIEVIVDGTSLGRSPLGAVPYSVEADTASNAAPGSTLSTLAPPGTVIAYAGAIGGASNIPPPNGWLFCDGHAVSRAAYSNLFAVLGTSAGAGDGTTSFNLPDYRGYFLRGQDQGSGHDPDVASRSSMAVEATRGMPSRRWRVRSAEPRARRVGSGAHPRHRVAEQLGVADLEPQHSRRRDWRDSDLRRCTGCRWPGNHGGCGDGDLHPEHRWIKTRPVNASVNYLIKY